MKVFLGIGTNLGNKEANVLKSVDLINQKIKNTSLKVAKSVISKPHGFHSNNFYIVFSVIASANCGNFNF